MSLVTGKGTPSSVALLAEGVDRNTFTEAIAAVSSRSPSSRRAWIEILISCAQRCICSVALLAEGVDRNRPR